MRHERGWQEKIAARTARRLQANLRRAAEAEGETSMSREAFGDPPEPQTPRCPVCDGTEHTNDCELGEEMAKRQQCERELAEWRELALSQAGESGIVARMVKAETELGLRRAVADWVKADASRFRWLVEDHADPGTRQAARDLLGRLGVMSYGAACDAIDSARRECAQREELMSVSNGRKVGELTRKIRRQQAGRG